MLVSTGQLSNIDMQTGAAPVDSAPEEKSSTRCKLQGILTWLAMIEKLIGRKKRGTIEVGCDSEKALKGIRKWLKNMQHNKC